MVKYFFEYEKITGVITGFYANDINKIIPSETVEITKELWQYLLLDMYRVDINSLETNEIFNIDDKDRFEVIPPETSINKNPLNDIVKTLEVENADVILQLAQKDSEIANLENDTGDIMFQLAQKDETINSLEEDTANLLLSMAELENLLKQ